MQKKSKGKLMIIGGAERRDGGEAILAAVAQTAINTKGSLVVITAATYTPEGTEAYVERFRALGVKQVDLLDIRTREDAMDEEKAQMSGSGGHFLHRRRPTADYQSIG